MEDFPVDPGTFFVPGPVWVLERKAGGMVEYAGGRTSKARYLFVFTDLHLAEKFLEDAGAPGFAPRQMPSPAAYGSFLEAVRPAYDRVAYDPPVVGSVGRTSFAIERVIDDVRRTPGESQT
jgi:hypothetical protein